MIRKIIAVITVISFIFVQAGFVFAEDAPFWGFTIEPRLGYHGVAYRHLKGHDKLKNYFQEGFSIGADVLFGKSRIVKIGVGMQVLQTGKIFYEDDYKDLSMPAYFTIQYWRFLLLIGNPHGFTKINIGKDITNNSMYYGIGIGWEMWNVVPIIMYEYLSGEYSYSTLSFKLGYKFHL
jgi:hypothetical protein